MVLQKLIESFIQHSRMHSTNNIKDTPPNNRWPFVVHNHYHFGRFIELNVYLCMEWTPGYGQPLKEESKI